MCPGELGVRFRDTQNTENQTRRLTKDLKRAMAAEFSRELGVKVLAAQRLIASNGFRVGGTPGYGFRRMLTSADGHNKRILNVNERKSFSSDNVVLVPGPRHEVECIRTIFDLAADKRNTPLRIAKELNDRRVKFIGGKPWNESNIYRILKNEKYMGNQTWGKTHKYRVCSPENWIRKPNAFSALITHDQFAKAQKAIHKRANWPKTPDELLIKQMKRVLRKEGQLTERLLQKHGHFGYRRYVSRLGSVIRAYEIVGYHAPARVLRGMERKEKIKQIRSELVVELKKLFPLQLRMIRLPGQVQRQVVELEHNMYVAIQICRPSESTVSGNPRWVLRAQPKEKGLATLICTCAESLDRITRFYVVPDLGDVVHGCKIFGEGHRIVTAGRRLQSLSEFCDVATEVLANRKPQDNGVVARGDVVFTLRSSTVTVAGSERFLPPTTAVVFKLLVNNAGVVVSRDTLAQAILEASQQQTTAPHYLDEHVTYQIYALRKNLGQSRCRIVTVKGIGYKYKNDPRVNWRVRLMSNRPQRLQVD